MLLDYVVVSDTATKGAMQKSVESSKACTAAFIFNKHHSMYGGSTKLTQQAAAKQAQQHAVVTTDPKLQVVTSALYQSRYIISEFKDKLLDADKQCSDQAMQGEAETRTNSWQAQTMEKQENV